MSVSLSHWYPESGVVLNLSIPDLCTLTYFIVKWRGKTLFSLSYIQASLNKLGPKGFLTSRMSINAFSTLYSN